MASGDVCKLSFPWHVSDERNVILVGSDVLHGCWAVKNISRIFIMMTLVQMSQMFEGFDDQTVLKE